uniref:Uncharacterized protein n=1 Tax=Ciona savignyi TaxID=51511 RepID=H2ZPR8_CIOSA
MGGEYLTFVTDLSAQQTIAKEKTVLTFRKSLPPVLKQVFDYNSNSVDDEYVKLFPKHFQGKALENLVSKMNKCLQNFIINGKYYNEEWMTVGLRTFVESIICPASFVSIFGEYSSSRSDKMTEVERNILKFTDLFPSLIRGYPISILKGATACRQYLWKVLSKQEISGRKNVNGVVKETISLHELYGESDVLPKRLLSFLTATQVNSVPSAIWLLYFLHKHPEANKVAREEIERVLKESKESTSKDVKIEVTNEDLKKMTVLDSIINESFRLHLAPSMFRIATEDYFVEVAELGRTYKIRKNDKVLLWVQMNQMDPDIFEQPEVFQFDRFLNEDGSRKKDFYKNGRLMKCAFQPFGTGLSKCPGRYFAVNELKQLAITTLRFFDIELVNPQAEIKMDKNRIGLGALYPATDIKIRIRRKADC